MDPSTWPAIKEPPGSVTIDLSPIFGRDDSGFGADEAAVNDLVLDALVESFAEGSRLLALDWQTRPIGSSRTSSAAATRSGVFRRSRTATTSPW
jgi:hypothetical protein